MASTAILASLDEYDVRTAAGERLEFDRGVLIPMPDNDSLHESVKAKVVGQLNRQLDDPIQAGNELTFEVSPNQVRHPDVAVLLRPPAAIAGHRLQGAPQLAIEIVSPSDNASDLDEKINLYLANGARAVWVVWPGPQRIDIHQTGQPTRHYYAADTLAGEEPVPQFRLPVSSLFV